MQEKLRDRSRAPTQIAIGLALLLVGIPIYIKYSPKKEIAELKETLISREATLKRAYEQEHTFFGSRPSAHQETIQKSDWQETDLGRSRMSGDCCKVQCVTKESSHGHQMEQAA